MKTVKSLEDLQRIRDKVNKNLDLRKVGEGEDIKIKVGMATCGIAAGARETFNILMKEIEKRRLKDVYVVQVGCMGYCHAEPTVEVDVPGQPPIIYGNIDKEKAVEMIEKHIEKGELLQDAIISKIMDRV